MLAETETQQMSTDLKRLPYKETLHCSIAILLFFSLASTLAIDFLIFIMIGAPKLSIDTFKWVFLFSLAVFAISYFCIALRYRVKIKIAKGFIEQKIFLSLKGVGKGTWLQIPVDSIVSCKPHNYDAPTKGFFILLLTSHAPFKYRNSTSIYPLPGYKGMGINIKYKRELSLSGGMSDLLIPTKNPEILCKLLQ